MKKLFFIVWLSMNAPFARGMDEMGDMPATYGVKKVTAFDWAITIANNSHCIAQLLALAAVRESCDGELFHPDCKNYEGPIGQTLWPTMGTWIFNVTHHFIAPTTPRFHAKDIIRLALVYTSILTTLGTTIALDNASLDCKYNPNDMRACTIFNDMGLWIPFFVECSTITLNVLNLCYRR